jgi:hypothetical protein
MMWVLCTSPSSLRSEASHYVLFSASSAIFFAVIFANALNFCCSLTYTKQDTTIIFSVLSNPLAFLN